MEFEMCVDFFNTLVVVKKKYPLIVSYIKYLTKLKKDQQQNEIDLFKHFMIENQKEAEFDHAEFITGKSSLSLNMNMFVDVPDFWTKYAELERIFFPQGKPTKEETKSVETASNAALKMLETNPMFKDIVCQIRSQSEDLTNFSNFGDIINNPEIKNIIEKLKFSISSGQYKIQDLTSTLGTIVESVKGELDEDTCSTLNTVMETVATVERGETIDEEKCLKVLNLLQLK